MTSRLRVRLLLSCVGLCAYGAASLSATTLAPPDFARMVRESELIVHATVVSVESRLAGPGRTIESLITVRVADTLKGAAVEETVFRVPGGRVGRYRRVMVGAPQFTAGDEVILFLSGRAPALATPFGLSQGVYRVSRRSGVPLVTPLLENRPGPVTRGDPARRPPDVAAFARQVRTALAAGAASPRCAAPRP